MNTIRSRGKDHAGTKPIAGYNAQRQAEDEVRAEDMMKQVDRVSSMDEGDEHSVRSYLQGTLCRFPVVYVPCVRLRAVANTSVTLGWLSSDMKTSCVEAVVQVVTGTDDAKRYEAMLLCFATVPVAEMEFLWKGMRFVIIF